MISDDLILIGSVIKSKGLKGSLKLNSELRVGMPTQPLEVYILKNSNLIPFQASSLKWESKDLILNLKEISTLEEASTLTGLKVYAQKDNFSIKKPAFSYEDLVGYILSDEEQGLKETIQKVQKFPQQWIATVQEKGLDLLIPLNEDSIVKIDRRKKIVSCNLPDGLLEIYRNP